MAVILNQSKDAPIHKEKEIEDSPLKSLNKFLLCVKPCMSFADASHELFKMFSEISENTYFKITHLLGYTGFIKGNIFPSYHTLEHLNDLVIIILTSEDYSCVHERIRNSKEINHWCVYLLDLTYKNDEPVRETEKPTIYELEERIKITEKVQDEILAFVKSKYDESWDASVKRLDETKQRLDETPPLETKAIVKLKPNYDKISDFVKNSAVVLDVKTMRYIKLLEYLEFLQLNPTYKRSFLAEAFKENTPTVSKKLRKLTACGAIVNNGDIHNPKWLVNWEEFFKAYPMSDYVRDE